MGVSENVRLAKVQWRGGASLPLHPPQLRAVSLAGPTAATLAASTRGNQTGSGTRLKCWLVPSMLVSYQSPYTSSIPGHTVVDITCQGLFPVGSNLEDEKSSDAQAQPGPWCPPIGPERGATWFLGPGEDVSAAWEQEHNMQGAAACEQGSATAPSTPASCP